MQLYIDSYGSFIHVKDEMFEVKTKSGDDFKKSLISPSKISSIFLSKGTSISSEAVRLALMHNIDILFLEFDGMPLGRVWHSKLGSTTKIRKCQLVASMNSTGVKFVKEWLSSKISNQKEFLADLKKNRPEHAGNLADKIESIESHIKSIKDLEADNINEISDQIRGYEGTSSRLYFSALGEIIPKEFSFDKRSSRPAQDHFNAFLNYSYGILYSKIEKALIIAGIDPYLGFMHRDDYNQLSMVFDFIEPFRIFAERTVFFLFSRKKVNKSSADKVQGGFTLNKEGKMLLIEAYNKFMDEEQIKYKGRNQTRNNIIQFEAHALASSLLNKKFDYKDIEKYDLLGDV